MERPVSVKAKSTVRTKKFIYEIQTADAGKQIESFVFDKLLNDRHFPVTAKVVRNLFAGGWVFINKSRTKIPSFKLNVNDTVSIIVPLDDMPVPKIITAYDVTREDIAYEDKYIIVVNKPAGLPTQGTLDKSRDHLFAAVERFMLKREDDRKNEDPTYRKEPIYVGLHHRLDRDTSGLVLFTKKKEANAGVTQMFMNHEFQKRYVLLAHKNPKHDRTRWVVNNHLQKSKDGVIFRVASCHSGGDLAVTSFILQKDYAKYVLVTAKPKTGRMHQIRVHMSEAGMPLLGDTTYGALEKDQALGLGPIPRCMLHAAELAFTHPMTQKLLTITAEVPEDFKKYL